MSQQISDQAINLQPPESEEDNAVQPAAPEAIPQEPSLDVEQQGMTPEEPPKDFDEALVPSGPLPEKDPTQTPEGVQTPEDPPILPVEEAPVKVSGRQRRQMQRMRETYSNTVQQRNANWQQGVTVQATDTAPEIFFNAFATGSSREDDAAEFELIKTADYFFASHDKDGPISGAIENGLQVIDSDNKTSVLVAVNKEAPLESTMRKMLNYGSMVIAHEIPLDSEDPAKQIRTRSDGTQVAIKPYRMNMWFETAKLTGQKLRKGEMRDGRYVEPIEDGQPTTPFGKIADYIWASEESGRFKFVNRMSNMYGITNPIVQNAILAASDRGFVRSFRQGESIKDQGKFFYNLMVGLSNVEKEDILSVLEPKEEQLTHLQRREARLGKKRARRFEGLEIDFENETVRALGAAVTDRVVNNIIQYEPEKVIEKDGKKQVSSEYYAYASQQIANSLGIDVNQAEMFMRERPDLIEAGIDLAIEGAPIVGGGFGISMARGVLFTNPAFKRWVQNKYKTASFDGSIEKAKKDGFTTSDLQEQFVEEVTSVRYRKVPGTEVFVTPRFLREGAREAKLRRLQVAGELTTPQLRARNAQNIFVQKANDKYIAATRELAEIPRSNRAARIKGRAQQINAYRQAAMAEFSDRPFPTALFNEAKLEFGFAYGAALGGDALTSYVGEEGRGYGEFGGALMAFTLGVPALKATGRVVSRTPVVGTAARTVWLKTMKALGEADDLETLDSYFGQFSKGSLEGEIRDLLFDKATPAFRVYLMNQARETENMLNSLSEIRLPNGDKAFPDPDSLRLMLYDVTQLSVLKSYSDSITTMISAQDVANKNILADELQSNIDFEAEIARRISGTLKQFDRALQSETITDTQRQMITSFRDTLSQEAQDVNRRYAEVQQAISGIKEEFEILILNGKPIYNAAGDLAGLDQITPEAIISQQHLNTIAKYVDDDTKKYSDFDGLVNEIKDNRQETEALYRLRLQQNKEIGNVDNQSKIFVSDTQRRFANDKQDVNLAFRTVEDVSRTAMADAGVLIRLLRDQQILGDLTDNLESIAFSSRINTELQAQVAAQKPFGSASVRHRLIDGVAIDYFKGNRQFKTVIEGYAGKPLEEMSDIEIREQLSQIVDIVYDDEIIPPAVKNIFGETERPRTEAQIYDFFNTYFRTPEGQASEFAQDLGVNAQNVDKVMRAGVNIETMSEIVEFLGKNIDPSSAQGVALMKVRKHLKNGIMKGFQVDENGDIVRDSAGLALIDPKAGFKEDFYGDNPQDITEEFRVKLEAADSLYGEHLARFYNKEVPTHNITGATISQSKEPSALILPKLINNAVKKAQTPGANPAEVMTDTLGADLARMHPEASVAIRNSKGQVVGFEFDQSTEAGKLAIDEARKTIINFGQSVLLRTKFGEEFTRRMESGQVYSLKMSKGRVTQLVGMLGETPDYKVQLEDKNAIQYVRTLTSLQVKNADGTLEPLVKEDDIWAPFEFDVAAQDIMIGEGKRRVPVTMANNRLFRDVKAAVTVQSKLVKDQAEANRALLDVMNQMNKSITAKGGPPLTFVDMLQGEQSEEAVRILSRTKENFIQNAEDPDIARKQFEDAFKDMAFEDLLFQTQTGTKAGDIDLNKFTEKASNPQYISNLRQISPVAADNIEAMGRYVNLNTGRMQSGVRLAGAVQPLNTASEMSRLFAVWSGRTGYTWYGLTLLTQSSIRAKQKAFGALIENPEAGRVFMEIANEGRRPTNTESALLYRAFVPYLARDYVLYSDSEEYGSFSEDFVVKPGAAAARTAGRAADKFFFGSLRKNEEPLTEEDIAPDRTSVQHLNKLNEERITGAQ